MPRRIQQFETQVLATPTVRVASAKRLSMRSGEDKPPKDDNGWQRTAWMRFDTIGEYRYACSWVGNLLSRATLVVTEDGKPTTDPDAIAAMEALFGGTEGQQEMLRELGIQFTVAGEAYIVGEDGGEDPGDKWWVIASTEISKTGEDWKIGKKPVNDPLVIRLWKPHPRANNKPDSPSRAVLPILAEINGLTEHIAASIDSRLAGAGILLLPDNISFATTSETNSEGQASVTGGLDSFLEELMQTMMTAIGNRSDPSALVPILLQAAGGSLNEIRHLTLSTPFDERSVELRTEAIRRLALGMDMPPEILTGTADVNHWGSWQIEEAAIKAHTEPLLMVITSSLTEGYLRPYLEGLDGWDEERARRFTITADTSKLRLRPNRSKEAIELYDRAELSADTMLRENGFDPESDAMTDEERTLFYTQKVAGGSTTPELVAEALRILGVPVMNLPSVEVIDSQEGRPVRSLIDHPEQVPPEEENRRVISDEAAAIAEVVMFRALERAGNRIKSKYRERISMGAENVPTHTLYRFTRGFSEAEVDDLLIDAWSCLGSLPPISVNADTLNEYARMLLTANRPHDSRKFRAFITTKGSM